MGEMCELHAANPRSSAVSSRDTATKLPRRLNLASTLLLRKRSHQEHYRPNASLRGIDQMGLELGLPLSFWLELSLTVPACAAVWFAFAAIRRAQQRRAYRHWQGTASSR
jgi:hypothetical protein